MTETMSVLTPGFIELKNKRQTVCLSQQANSLLYEFGVSIMAISPELLEILRCPKCKSKIELKADQSGLKCTNSECSLVYPIRDEIPVMLVDEATVEK